MKGLSSGGGHSREDATIYWYLDNMYLAQTVGVHEKALLPETGHHRLYVVDDRGHSQEINFYSVVIFF